MEELEDTENMEESRRLVTSDTEFSDDILLLAERLEEESQERDLNRNEQVVIDILDTIGLVEQEGLLEFWGAPLKHDSIIKSFDMIDASTIVDVFNSSQWVLRKISETSQFTDRESTHLSEIEEELFSELWEVPELLEAFIEDELEDEMD